MKCFNRLIHRLLFVTVLAGATPLVSDAATYEEAQRLDTAYPVGSEVVCRADLAGDGQHLLPMTLITRAVVSARDSQHVVYDVSVAWLTAASASGGLTLRFRMTQRSDETGHYSTIDPDSMAVVMPGVGPEGENTILQGFRARLTGDEQFAPYSQIDITDFPSYVIHKPGDPPSYCHKTQNKAG